MVASNSDDVVRDATSDAFSHYDNDPSDISKTIDKLTKPLKGIGPAAGSLILSIHDPENVIFFSDEAYRWLVKGGEKTKILYNSSEFEELYNKAKELKNRLQVSPIDIEKVAYVLIRESEPADEPKPKKEPSGRPRGRPAKPDSEKKTKKPAVPGRGRGRPRGSTKVPPKPPTTGEPRKRGRPPKDGGGAAKSNKRQATEEAQDPGSAHDEKRAKA